jgi:hypothetical protein
LWHASVARQSCPQRRSHTNSTQMQKNARIGGWMGSRSELRPVRAGTTRATAARVGPRFHAPQLLGIGASPLAPSLNNFWIHRELCAGNGLHEISRKCCRPDTNGGHAQKGPDRVNGEGRSGLDQCPVHSVSRSRRRAWVPRPSTLTLRDPLAGALT